MQTTINEATTEALRTLLPTGSSSARQACSGWRPSIDAYEPSLQKAADLCARFVADMEAGAPAYWLTFVGCYGCGKTMLAQQVFEQAKRINPGNPANNPIWPPNWETCGARTHETPRPYCIWLDEKDFAARIRGGDYGLPETLREDFCVVVDELGFTRDPTNFVSEAIARLCQARLNRWTIFATNLSFDEINQKMDGRIASRIIRDDNRVAKITAGDFALRKLKTA